MTKERIASSVALPPAFLMTCASPSANPAYLAGTKRASIHVNIAKPRAGGNANSDKPPKVDTYASFAETTSWYIFDILSLL